MHQLKTSNHRRPSYDRNWGHRSIRLLVEIRKTQTLCHHHPGRPCRLHINVAVSWLQWCLERIVRLATCCNGVRPRRRQLAAGHATLTQRPAGIARNPTFIAGDDSKKRLLGNRGKIAPSCSVCIRDLLRPKPRKPTVMLAGPSFELPSGWAYPLQQPSESCRTSASLASPHVYPYMAAVTPA